MDTEPFAIPAQSVSSSGRSQVTLSHLDSISLSPSAGQLLACCAADQFSEESLLPVLGASPTLMAGVLAAAGVEQGNGAVMSLQASVQQLEPRRACGLALVIELLECVKPSTVEGEAARFDPVLFWEHSLAVGLGCGLLAESVGKPWGVAFLAGLLHDLGKIALATVYPKAYERIAAQTQGSHGDISDVEREVLGLDHTLAGRYVAQRWQLQPELVEAIQLHHLAPGSTTEEPADQSLMALVRCADVMAREHNLGFSGNFMLLNRSADLASDFGIDQTRHDHVAQRLADEVRSWVRLLNLYGDSASEVHQRAVKQAQTEFGLIHRQAVDSAQAYETKARYFDAFGKLDSELGVAADITTLARALSLTMPAALESRIVLAFVIHSRELHACVISKGIENSRTVELSQDEPLTRWLSQLVQGIPSDLPDVLSRSFGELLNVFESERQHWLPLLLDGQLSGGLVFGACDASPQSLAVLQERLVTIVRRTLMLVDSQGLSDELAESNRRLQKRQNAMLRTRTLESIAEIASGAGHEMNNPLSVISGRAQMMRSRVDERAQKDLSLIIEKAHECSHVVHELMDFARPLSLVLEVLDFGALVQARCDAWIGENGEAGDRLRIDIALPLASVSADREQFGVVISELLGNAALATEHTQGLIELSVSASDSSWVVLRVKDHGPGMNSDVLARVFDPFFSHHPAGRRRGLGLARTQRIVQAHGGRIWIDSLIGQGTCVNVLMPIKASDR